MKKLLILALTLTFLNLSTSLAEDALTKRELPRVLIIGDSISLGYTPYVAKMLKDQALVKHHRGNAQHTATGLQKLDLWIGDTHWDVIHFNWGLWDLCYRHPDSKVQGNRDKVNGTVTIPLDQYETNLDVLVTRLKTTGAKLIWAHTTVVPENEAGRFVGDDKKYNDVATRVMKKHGVAINDLHRLTRHFSPGLFTAPGNVHYTGDGYQRIAQQVADKIRTTGGIMASEAKNTVLVACGEFVNIYDPSVKEDNPWYINDHCFIQGDDHTWHLFGITHAEPANPLNEINFAHATARTLLQQPWDKQPYALSVARKSPWHEAHLWAPHVIRHEGTYYMYYCAGDRDHTKYKIHLVTSPDLKTWTRHPKNPMVVDGFDARDPFILRVKDKWVMYYTANSNPDRGNHIVACVTSKDLLTWGNRSVVFTDPTTGTYGGPTESPFVVQRGDQFYLFMGPRQGYDGTSVFVSDDPFHWETDSRVGHFRAHAAEIVRDNKGNWYISRCGWGRGGVFLAPLIWKDGQSNPITNIEVPRNQFN